MSEYYTSKKCWQCGDWLVRTRGPNVRYYHCEQCKGDRNGKSRHPFEENKDVIAALSLLRIGTMCSVVVAAHRNDAAHRRQPAC
jgi:hypothetical protein